MKPGYIDIEYYSVSVHLIRENFSREQKFFSLQRVAKAIFFRKTSLTF